MGKVVWEGKSEEWSVMANGKERARGQMIMLEDVGRPFVRRKGWKKGLVVFCEIKKVGEYDHEIP